MKKLLPLLFLLLSLAAAQPAALPAEPRFDAPIALRTGAAGESLRDVLLALASTVGLTAIVDDVPVTATINYDIADPKPFRQIWSLVLTLNQLDYVLLENDIVVVGSPETVSRLRERNGVPLPPTEEAVLQRFFRIEGNVAVTQQFLQQEFPGVTINALPEAGLLSIRATPPELELIEGILAVIDQPVETVATEQRLYTLSNAVAAELAVVLQASAASLLQTTMGEDGQPLQQTQASEFVVVADPRSNSLLVTAPPAVQRRITELLPQLDAPQPQVNVQVRIQEISRRSALDLGLNLNAGLGNFAATIIGGGTAPGASFVFNPQSVLSGLNIGATLDTLEAQGLSRRVDDSNLTVVNNAPARINSGGRIELTFPSTEGQVSQRTIEFGVIVEIVPRISADGRLNLDVRAEVSDIATPLGTGVPDRIDFITREVSSSVSLVPGQTVVLGGLIQNVMSETVNRTPVLGQLPLIGGLFTSTVTSEENTELFLIINATIIE